MRQFRSFGASALAGLALMLVGGCYQTHDKLFANGTDAGILPGQFECTDPDNRDNVHMTIAQQGSPGDMVYAYEYDAAKGRLQGTARIRRLKSGLLLIQSDEDLAHGLYDYVFMTIGAPDSFSIALPRLDPTAMAARFGVRIDAASFSPTSGQLIGPPEAAISFLESFSPADLRTTTTCRRHGP